jgi:probable addiction module antidote protein
MTMTTTVKTRPLDIAELLDSDEAIADYITDALEDDEPTALVRALGTVARARGMSLVARETGLARAALYRSLSGSGNPELETVRLILKTLNLRLTVEPIKAAE